MVSSAASEWALPRRRAFRSTTITVWFRERNLLDQLRWRLRTELLPANAIEQVIEQERGERPRPVHALARDRSRGRRQASTRSANSRRPCGPSGRARSIGTYQLLCLRSFVDRGHRVELFSYEPALDLPDWITRKDAAEILPRERVLRFLPEQRRFAVHADLFRLALLHRLGGWWIDPDVVLLRAKLPEADLWFAHIFETGVISTAAMKFPAGTSPTDARRSSRRRLSKSRSRIGARPALPFSRSLWPRSARAPPPLEFVRCPGPPCRAFSIRRRPTTWRGSSTAAHFLDLHQEVWQRAGIPGFLGPPRGSFLDRLFQRHEFGLTFAAEMEFGDVKRWLTHMYDSIRLREAFDA